MHSECLPCIGIHVTVVQAYTLTVCVEQQLMNASRYQLVWFHGFGPDILVESIGAHLDSFRGRPQE